VRGGQVYFCQFQRTPFGMLRLDPQVCPRRLPGALRELCGYQACLDCTSCFEPRLTYVAGCAVDSHPPPAVHAPCALAMRLGSYCFAVAERPARVRQDMGPGYRNVIGIPGGVRSPLFKVLQVGDPAPACRSRAPCEPVGMDCALKEIQYTRCGTLQANS
jgi:hypothetical protein